MAKVMIDPGHNGWNVNPGVEPGYYEGTMAWKLSEYLLAALRAYGIQADRTKTGINEAMSLWNRGRKADGYDLFISLHSDACGTESVDRCTVFRMVPDSTTDDDEKSAALAQLLAPAVTEAMGLHDPYQVKAWKASGDRNGDGLDNDNYLGVLHACQSVGTPGVLVEHGFHTNRAVCRWLMDDANLQKLAQAEAAAIAQYFGIHLVGGFVDVAPGSYYADSVVWAVEQGITKGTDQTHFSPDEICSRGQAVTLLWRQAGSPEPADYMPFGDVDPAGAYAKAIQWAVEHKITLGTGPDTFEPDAPCTRGQFATFLWRSAGHPAGEGKPPFYDIIGTEYFYEAVRWAYQQGIVAGTDAHHFHPLDPCTRAQAVTMLSRAD